MTTAPVIASQPDRLPEMKPATSPEIADGAGLDERYVREWLGAMVTGGIVEIGPAMTVLSRPAHPYSIALKAAAPRLDTRQVASTLGLLRIPEVTHRRRRGCAYLDRCPHATDACRTDEPELQALAAEPGNRRVACHHPEVISDNSQVRIAEQA